MPGNEDLRRGRPDNPTAKPITFGEYSEATSEDDPTSWFGLIPLNVDLEVLGNWITDLRTALGSLNKYVSGNPSEIFSGKFTLEKKGEDSVKIRLRRLQRLQTPITLVLKPDSARIAFPLGYQGTSENPRKVVEEAGVSFWADVPNRVRNYIDQNPKNRSARPQGPRTGRRKKGSQN